MDHDRNFKELLSHFFLEFVDLFLEKLAAEIDRDVAIVPLDKEVFTDVLHGESHEVDLVMRAKFRGEDAFFLIHVENQATAQSDFPLRMFSYFARLTEKYHLPVYPVVIFSYDAPMRPEPKQYIVTFPGKTVLKFEYTVIQLNRLSWRRFVKSENPVACALMAKMKIEPRDRPRVRLECLRLLASLKLDPARSKLIGGFIDAYLTLTADEMKQYERQIAALNPIERNTTMALISTWEQRGIEQGIKQGIEQGIKQGIERGIKQGMERGLEQGMERGKEEMLAILLEQRFSTLPEGITQMLDQLTSDQLNKLGKAIFSFTSLDDLKNWLEQR